MIAAGQRWYSEAEPELGLGIILDVQNKLIKIEYPLCEEIRTYSRTSSPLKRYILNKDDDLITEDKSVYKVQDINNTKEVISYITKEGLTVSEKELTSKIDLQGPLNRVIVNNFDNNNFFQLKYNSFLNYRYYQGFKLKGALSPKVRLIPHQIYVANKILALKSPKAMLCDEVGLGKTIEASLIASSLITRELVKNIIIIVPDSLTNQWFVELYKKFNLSFQTVTEDNLSELEFDQLERIILGQQFYKANNQSLKKITDKKWDMLIVDESHQIDIKNIESPLVSLIKDINSQTYSTLFLSATPEVLGAKNLFAQLNILDPLKYKTFEEFSNQLNVGKQLSSVIRDLKRNNIDDKKLESYISLKEIRDKTPDELVQILVDRFGTGRTYFRNSRQNLEQYSKLFNKRILHEYPIKISKKITDKLVIEQKSNVILEILKQFHDEKILVICHSRDVVTKLQNILKSQININIALFHSGQSLMERDRQAAYFAESSGAQILLTTEVGSEGRNFEFASHMVLFDLPKVPDQLEQRIGRLDRIGQENDINIHIPYIESSFEHSFFRWYNEVLSSFTTSPKGASQFYKTKKHLLVKLLESEFNQEKLDSFITTSSQEYANYCKELEEGRDLLVESHSYNDKEAKELCHYIQEFENSKTPENFIEMICHNIAIDLEQLNDKTYFVRPSDNMLLPSYPGLTSEGFSYTFNREFALINDQIQFMSWESPFIQGSFDLLINSQLGNTSYVQQDILPRNIYFEFILNLQCKDKNKYISSVYLPFTPVRVLLNLQGKEFTKEYPKKHLDNSLIPITDNSSILELLSNVPNDIKASLSKQAIDVANRRVEKYKNKALEQINKDQQSEINRFLNLQLEAVKETESIKQVNEQYQQVIKSITESTITLDSIRIIVPKT